MHRLLQLSDIHFGRDHAFAQGGIPQASRTFSDAVRLALAENDLPAEYDVLLITGDIFTSREPEERTEARLQLAELSRALKVGVTVCVPGNHDVDWRAKPPDRLYDYGYLVDEIDALGAPGQFPVVHVVESDGLRPLALLGLDSCQLESKAQSGLGLVGEVQLDRLAATMRARGIGPDSHTLVVALHHHLLPVATLPVLPATANPGDSDRLVVSLTVDATTVLSRLAELGISLVLHGHQHITALMQFTTLRWSRRLWVASAGSVALRKAEVRRQFFVWEIGDDFAEVVSLRHRDDDLTRFERDTQHTARISLG